MSTALVSERVASLLASPHEHQGQRVVTLAQIDVAHGRKPGTARDTFRRVKGRLVEGRDYFRAPRGSNPRSENGKTSGPPGEQIMLTERGYTLLVKPFTDGGARARGP